jgi:hypothetical protein
MGKRLALLAVVIAVTACRHLGPSTIPDDRFDYSASIAESWKRQTLLNVVKMRYLDLPIFVDVGQIVSGYSFSTGLAANGSIGSVAGDPQHSLSLSGDARFGMSDDLHPVDRSAFVRGLMSAPSRLGLLHDIRGGWPTRSCAWPSRP